MIAACNRVLWELKRSWWFLPSISQSGGKYSVRTMGVSFLVKMKLKDCTERSTLLKTYLNQLNILKGQGFESHLMCSSYRVALKGPAKETYEKKLSSLFKNIHAAITKSIRGLCRNINCYLMRLW